MEYRARYEARHPGRLKAYSRDFHLQKKYGLTANEWDLLFQSQGRRCAACGTDKPGSPNGWHTDHAGPLPCTRERVRGILCIHCNHAIGRGTDVELERELRRVAYLEKFR